MAENSRIDRRPPRWLPPLLVVVVALALHGASAGYDFTFDDRPIIVEKSDLRSLHAWRQVVSRDWWGNLAYDRLWRPLTLLSFAAQGAIAGTNAAGGPEGIDAGPYHAVNVALDALVALLVWSLARGLGASAWAAAAAAVAFSALGVHVEPVVNVVGRADLLATLAVLAALLVHRRNGVLAGGAAAVLFTLGLLAKESAVAFPVLAVALDLFAERRFRGWRQLGYGVALAGYLVARLAVLGSLTRPVDATLRYDNPIAVASPVSRELTAVAVLGRYAGSIVWPRGLSPNYGFDHTPLATSLADPWVLAGLVSHGGLLLLAGVLASRGPSPCAFGIFFYLLALFPVSNLLLVIGTIRADRLLYLPTAGLAVALTFALDALARRRRGLAVTAAVAFIATQAALTVERLPDWRDENTLLAAATRAAPRSVVVRNLLARARLRAGDAPGALLELEAAVAIAPDGLRVLHELGELQIQLGRSDAAEATFRHAIAVEPRDHIAWNFLGSLRYRRGDREGALEAFTRAVTSRPGYAKAQANRGRLLVELGRDREGLAAWAAALAADPGVAGALTQQAAELAAAGARERAAALAHIALVSDPANPEARRLLDEASR